jgi:hypothetical protein
MKEFLKDLRQSLIPNRWDAWQTLLLLSGLSAVFAAITEPPVQTLLSACGWLWLILSVWWFVYDVKKQLTFVGFWFAGPWIVAAAIGGFLISIIRDISIPALVVLWAPLAAVIQLLPNCIRSNPEQKTPEWIVPPVKHRQGMVLLLLSHLVVACWFQFYFLLQNWLHAYPSLLADRFDRSSFVINVAPPAKESRGADVLKLTEETLAAQLNQHNWPEVERWLLELNQQLPQLQATVRQKLEQQNPPSPENPWWKINAQVTGGEYDVQLQALWTGPSSSPSGYRVTLNCQVIPQMVVESPATLKFKEKGTSPALAPATSRFVAKVECEEPSEPQFDPESKAGVGV